MVNDAIVHEHDQLRAQMYRIRENIDAIKGAWETRRDLEAVNKNARVLWAKLDNEMIECRRRGRLTSSYTELAKQLRDYIKIMDKEVFWCKLH